MLLAAVVVPHLLWAQRLVLDLRSVDNSYGRQPTLVHWRGVDGETRSRNRSDCSSFITALWRRAYGYGPDEIRRWLGVAEPRAIDYHVAIVEGNRFSRIQRVVDLLPGDLLVTRYQTNRSGATGHVMLAAARPVLLGSCSQSRCLYRIEVIDSSRSGHGPADTRQGEDGVGQGVIQLQSSPEGLLLAYRWSERSSSRWRFGHEESLVVGRFQR